MTGSGGTLDLVGYVLQFGLLGLIFLDVAVFRKVFTLAWILKERDKRIEEQNATIERLTDLAENQVIPALTRATEVNKDYLQLLQGRQHGKG